MKKALFFLLLVLVMGVGLFAQDPTPPPGPALDPTTVEAILVIVTGGVVSLLTGVLKNLLKVTGVMAQVLAGIVGVAVVGVYFIFLHPPFQLATFALYSVVIFGEATGWYHLYKRSTA
jgi:uncharacterized membrane protein YeaQ/YmgE (transglycosylase-associated protein family)